MGPLGGDLASTSVAGAEKSMPGVGTQPGIKAFQLLIGTTNFASLNPFGSEVALAA